ncbi:predicted protein [Nematostella vectensis]|uniref:Major facilitator superfamily (MFS) profile domain-containing protein n=2 Tax=Nematostella vectensis TaxID=45351 RepID=A7SUJ6_NEMVE|nr:predicted protein [Nematostella vectensis]|eukprot:XP_001624715.1 predicted protein [Nematostella vectensis]
MATFIAALGPLSFGYCMGYSSAATTQLENKNATDLYLNADEITWFGSLLNIGAMLGGPIQGFLIDLIGRKFALILTSVPFCSGWLLIGFGKNAAMLNAGRFMSGLGVGMASLNVPVYISETASFSNRGAMGSINQLGITAGILISYAIGYAFDWRWSAVAGSFPAALLVVLMAFMPETARWLIAKKKETRARKTLLWLRGPDYDIDKELCEIKASIDTQNQRFSLKEFKNPSLLRPFLISMSLHFFQQFSGINAFMFYCATIFQKAGFKDPTGVPILIGAVQFVASAISLALIDRGGRRFLLIVAGVGMSISCFTCAVYFFITVNFGMTEVDIAWLSVTSVAVYIVGFALGWGPCTWLIMSEIFPVRARGTATGIATFFNWFCSFVVTKTFSALIDGLTEAGTFCFFGAFVFASVLFVYFFVPETKGKTLEEIQTEFETRGTRKAVKETNV